LDAPERRASVTGPNPDADSVAFWAALERDQIELQRCDHCHELRLPAMPTCPHCGERGASIELAVGQGSVYSWVEVLYPLDPQFADEVPYTVGVVELVEGPRIAARLEGTVDFGTAVEARFVHHADWTELRFAG
jgi:uncharacterized OB-fold protein